MKLHLFAPVLFVALLLAGCTGGPADPGPMPTAVPSGGSLGISSLKFVNGESGDAAVGATIAVAGRQSQMTDGQGQIAIQPPVDMGAMVDASLDGRFLPRNTMIRSINESITLWPVASSYPAEFFQELVFNEFVPGGRLSRPPSGTSYLLLSPEVASKRGLAEKAAQLATDATGGLVRYSVVDQAQNIPNGSVVHTIRLDPNLPSPCGMGNSYQGNKIIGGVIVCRDLNTMSISNYLNHEVGHTIGLGHDNKTLRGMMASIPVGNDYSFAEKLAIQLMFKRFPGTLFPDNDRNAQVLGNSRVTKTIACGQ